MEQLRAGVVTHYPRSTGEFLAWFRTDEDCLDYLERLPRAGRAVSIRPRCGDMARAGGLASCLPPRCAGCSSRTSVTAGTIFDRTRTPLTVGEHSPLAVRHAEGRCISALSLQRSLEIGSYQTAWAMLEASAAVGAGAPGPGPAGRDGGGGRDLYRRRRSRAARRPAPGKKVLTGVGSGGQGAEGDRPVPHGGAGRRVLRLASSLRHRPRPAGPRRSSPTPGWATTGWPGSAGVHQRRSQRAARARGEDPGEALARGAPGRLAGQAVAAWAPTRARSTRRTCPATSTSSRSASTAADRPAAAWCSTGCWSLAARHDPVRLPRPDRPPAIQGTARAARHPGHPPSLERPGANRPWRAAEMQLRLPYSG